MAENKSSMKKILLIAPAVIFLLIVVYLKLKPSSDNTETTEQHSNIPEPLKTDNGDTVSSRMEMYENDEQNKLNDSNRQDQKRKSLSEIMNMADKKEEQPTGDESSVSWGGGSTTDNKANTTTSTVNTAKKTTTKTQVAQNQVQTNTVVNKSTDEDEPTYGFGVYSKNSTTKKTNSTTTTNTEEDEAVEDNNFIEAELEEDLVVKNNSALVFILNQDRKIGGILFKKQSYMYGQALNRDYYFDVKISFIKNAADGKRYAVNLILYDENMSRGIKYDNKVNQAAKSGMSNASDEAVNTATGLSNNVASGVVNSTVQGAKQAIKKEPQTNLDQGYKVYFKSVKKQ